MMFLSESQMKFIIGPKVNCRLGREHGPSHHPLPLTSIHNILTSKLLSHSFHHLLIALYPVSIYLIHRVSRSMTVSPHPT